MDNLPKCSLSLPHMDNLPKCRANHVPLSPLTFLARAASAYAARTSIIYEQTRFTWNQTYDRSLRLAASLQHAMHIRKNDVVSVVAPNVPALYELHFAVPMAAAVLNTINTRLNAHAVATILRHSAAKALFVDRQHEPVAREALRILTAHSSSQPVVVVIDDEYEELIRNGNPDALDSTMPDDEWDPIALSYTSGTTSAPKGVVYSHRGAYLSALSLLLQWQVPTEPVYLWTLPMFHCNGWTLTWGIAARGGTNVCIRGPTAGGIYAAIAEHRVTHMCCVPTLFNDLLDNGARRPIAHPVQILTGGTPPAAELLERIEGAGFHVTHAFGMTEATGPALVCEWRERWNELPRREQSALKARQGISVLSLADVDVKDPDTMQAVRRDGKAVGEILLRGSSIMKGYYKDEVATSEAFRDGWFHTGDAGVVYPDGYVEIKDRLKDVIISGGENISSVEVEAVLSSHPAVGEAAVVAMPHPHWGETPCAFLTTKKKEEEEEVAVEVKEDMIISYCREKLSHFMVPKRIVFLDELPKSNTKIQKFKLREMAKNLDRMEKSPPKTTTTNCRRPPQPRL